MGDETQDAMVRKAASASTDDRGTRKSGAKYRPGQTDVVRARKILPLRQPSMEMETELGSYVLKKKLGEGSLGRVYMAEHNRLKRRVALKVLKQEAEARPMSVKRFFAEARTVNQLEHDNIVAITDFVEGSPIYYVMEYLEGRTLREQVDLMEPLPIPMVLSILEQLSQALKAVHSQGIVHRDLKPANIFLKKGNTEWPQVKLLDFGIAKLGDEIADEIGVKTNAGALIGTPEYMAPEQAIGIPVDARTDIYALGLLTYEMLVGYPAHESNAREEVLEMARNAEMLVPSVAREFPTQWKKALDDFVARCCQRNPKDRFQSVEEVLVALEEMPATQASPSFSKKLGLKTVIALAAGMIGLGFVLTRSFEEAEVSSASSANESSSLPKTVKIQIHSVPVGAEVRKTSDGSLLGRTPVSYEIERQDMEMELKFRHKGHQSTKATVSLNQNQTLRVTLAPKAKRPFPPRPALVKPAPTSESARNRRKPARRKPGTKDLNPKKSSKSIEKVETMNPFAND